MMASANQIDAPEPSPTPWCFRQPAKRDDAEEDSERASDGDAYVIRVEALARGLVFKSRRRPTDEGGEGNQRVP